MENADIMPTATVMLQSGIDDPNLSMYELRDGVLYSKFSGEPLYQNQGGKDQ